VSTAYRLLLCHRRRDGVRPSAMRDHWEGSRQRLMADLSSDLGADRYEQFQQLERGDLVYRALRFSRGPLVVGLLTAVRERRLPRFSAGSAAPGVEAWDVIEQFRYQSKEALLAALTSEPGALAMRRLVDDHPPWSARFQMIAAAEHPVLADPSPQATRVGVTFCLRAPSDLGRQAMLDHWLGSHAQLARSLGPALGFVAYSQLEADGDPALTAAVQSFGGGGEDYDGVAELYYADLGVLRRGLFRLRTQAANLKLVRDEITFIDMPRSTLVLGTNHPRSP
jgi:hypothetical protein